MYYPEKVMIIDLLEKNLSRTNRIVVKEIETLNDDMICLSFDQRADSKTIKAFKKTATDIFKKVGQVNVRVTAENSLMDRAYARLNTLKPLIETSFRLTFPIADHSKVRHTLQRTLTAESLNLHNVKEGIDPQNYTVEDFSVNQLRKLIEKCTGKLTAKADTVANDWTTITVSGSSDHKHNKAYADKADKVLGDGVITNATERYKDWKNIEFTVGNDYRNDICKKLETLQATDTLKIG